MSRAKDPAFLFYTNDCEIPERKWNTPNTYDINFKNVPKSSGVYMLVAYFLEPLDWEIIYVGSSGCLFDRYKNHEKIRALSNHYDYVRFYFIDVPDDQRLNVEKDLIKTIQPKMNIQWR